MSLKLSDYDFSLPAELIASFPPQERPSAKLLFVNKQNGAMSHHIFREIDSFFKAGDVLVLNNTKVMPARIFGKKETGANVEALLLKELPNGEWKALLRPGGRLKKGSKIIFGEDAVTLEAQVLDDAVPDSVERTLGFFNADVKAKLAQIGHIPLPPYLDRPDSAVDREMYQTVFAQKEGAVASPTAGLHFDQALLEKLQAKGVEIIYVTLHVSYGTFAPVTMEDLTNHKMFAEEFEITEDAARKLNEARAAKRRIIACGTTSVRTLESAVDSGGKVKAQRAETRLFVYPSYQFKIVQGMITNFHLPKSTLLLLVAAFLGRDTMFKAYEEAIRHNYRFYSYGDAMLLL